MKKIVEKKHDQFVKNIHRQFGYKIAYFTAEHFPFITANHITYFRGLCGLIGCVILVNFQGYWWYFLSGILFYLFSMLDAADGCLAQIKGKSYFGGWVDIQLDHWGLFLIIAALTYRNYIIFNSNYYILFLGFGLYGNMQILKRTIGAKSKEKLWGDVSKIHYCKSETKHNSLFTTLKLQIAPNNANYLFFIIVGLILGHPFILLLSLVIYTFLWWLLSFLKTALFAARLDKCKKRKNFNGL